MLDAQLAQMLATRGDCRSSIFLYVSNCCAHMCGYQGRRQNEKKRRRKPISPGNFVHSARPEVSHRLPVCRAALDLGTRFDTRNTLFSIFSKESLRFLFLYKEKQSDRIMADFRRVWWALDGLVRQ